MSIAGQQIKGDKVNNAMPIVVVSNLSFHLAELGKIKIGGLSVESRTSASGRQYFLPEKYDYFVITSNERDSNKRLIVDQALMSKIGTKPKTLNVNLLYDNPLKNLSSFYGYYAGARKICWGDGKVAQRRKYIEKGEVENPTTKKKEKAKEWLNEWDNIPCKLDECKVYQAGQCKMHGILSVIIKESEIVGGVYRFRTSSQSTIRYLYSSMAFLGSITQGILAGIPFQLVLRPETKNAKDNQRHLVYTVNLVYPGSIEDLRKKAIAVTTQRSQDFAVMTKLAHSLEALPLETAVEEAEAQQEFEPENTDVDPAKAGIKADGQATSPASGNPNTDAKPANPKDKKTSQVQLPLKKGDS